MNVYRDKKFTKSIFLLIDTPGLTPLEERTKHMFQYRLLRRDGKYTLYTSKFYTNFLDCLADGMQKAMEYQKDIDERKRDYPKDWKPL